MEITSKDNKKKKKSALAVKNRLLAVKKKNLTTCRKKRIGFSEQKKEKNWVGLAVIRVGSSLTLILPMVMTLPS